ncbi:MAG TPA: PTS sugar transporter subunit IIA [Candidatus Marinimicrobia bacterium]|jgi:mannitol/fructose-specific phosphotransferase system IIA component (Ntr-type)|nr:PTS sugar transporter subunit IIA [Candidatus Neomarinimicrobiota bacterium]HPC37230.1 PTS sugar transporter subunit IIA [Candidatus Neomarinimicrobiota bacterium]HPD26228.1 PTS sugar transporter subunit IIA [Candidatus Neomarinimicrobiota bacterium]
MELDKILTPRLIVYPLSAETKEEVISILVERLYDEGLISNPEAAYQAVIEREKLMTTGIGKGVALPHGKYRETMEVLVAAGVSPEGIDFDSIDAQPVHIFILLLTPERFPSKHLKLLSKLSRMLNNANCRAEILAAQSANEIAEIFYKYDSQV